MLFFLLFLTKKFRIDDHVGVGVSGLIADGRVLSKFMRNQCLNHKFVYDSDLPISRLVHTVADSGSIEILHTFLNCS